jgi:hypothetical protein
MDPFPGAIAGDPSTSIAWTEDITETEATFDWIPPEVDFVHSRSLHPQMQMWPRDTASPEDASPWGCLAP